MSALGVFERLPFELRRQIYKSIYQATFVHCCCCSHLHKAIDSNQNEANTDLDLFNGYNCANNDVVPTLRTGKWSACMLTQDGKNVLSWNPFAFLRVSKTIWVEAESIAWQTLTLSVGVPQFKSLYNAHLNKAVRSTTPLTTRSHTLRNLHLTLPHYDTLAQKIGKSRISHGLSGYHRYNETCSETLRTLRKLSNLTDLILTVSEPSETTRWEFKSFWPPLVFYTPTLSSLKVWIAHAEDKFVRGDEAYLDKPGHEDEKVQHRTLGAMILAAKKVMTGDEPSPGEPPSGMNETAMFCWEAIMYTDVDNNAPKVVAFSDWACSYLKDG